MKNVEAKVIAATAGGASGGVVGSFLLWLLGVVVWHVPNDSKHSIEAMAAVPEPVGGFALFLLAGAGALIAGYWAPHTFRPDLAAKADPSTSSNQAEPKLEVPADAPSAVPADPSAPVTGTGV